MHGSVRASAPWAVRILQLFPVPGLVSSSITPSSQSLNRSWMDITNTVKKCQKLLVHLILRWFMKKLPHVKSDKVRSQQVTWWHCFLSQLVVKLGRTFFSLAHLCLDWWQVENPGSGPKFSLRISPNKRIVYNNMITLSIRYFGLCMLLSSSICLLFFAEDIHVGVKDFSEEIVVMRRGPFCMDLHVESKSSRVFNSECRIDLGLVAIQIAGIWSVAQSWHVGWQLKFFTDLDLRSFLRSSLRNVVAKCCKQINQQYYLQQ